MRRAGLWMWHTQNYEYIFVNKIHHHKMRWHRIYLPHGIQNVTVLRETKQLVGHRYRVHVRLLTIVEKCVRSPDALQHLHKHPQAL